jgi:hypothetical protein
VSGAQPLSARRQQVGDVTNDSDQLAGQRLRVRRLRAFASAALDAANEPIHHTAGARGVARAEDHMALVDVAGEDAFHVVRRKIHVSELDGGSQAGNRTTGRGAAGAARQVPAHVDCDLGFGGGFRPAAQ